jgi:hypothetical protein
VRVDQNLTAKRPRAVVSRFELAASRMADAWLRSGRITVTPHDLALAREFLQTTGWSVLDGRDGLLRLEARRSRRVLEVTPEGAVMLAMRRLARRR